MYEFFSGVSATGCLIVATFFLRFWSRSREPLFLFFSGAFALFSVTPILVGLAGVPQEHGWAFIFRLCGFLLIISGIAWSNMRHR